MGKELSKAVLELVKVMQRRGLSKIEAEDTVLNWLQAKTSMESRKQEQDEN